MREPLSLTFLIVIQVCFSPTVFRVSLIPSASSSRASTCGPWWHGHGVLPVQQPEHPATALLPAAAQLHCDRAGRHETLYCLSCSWKKGSVSALIKAGSPAHCAEFSERPECGGASKQAHSEDRRHYSVTQCPGGCVFSMARRSPSMHQSLLWALQPGLSQNLCCPDIYLHCCLPATVQLKTPQLLVYLNPLLLFFFFFLNVVHIFLF